MKEILKITELEETLVQNWTKFIDSRLLLKQVLEDANQIASLNIVHDKEANFNKKIQISITDFKQKENPSIFEICVEFTVPRENGILVGSHYYSLGLNGSFFLENSSGTLFLDNI